MTLIFRGYTQATCKACEGNSVDRKGRCPACHGTGTEYVEANVLFDGPELIRGLDRLAVDIHADNVAAGWWSSLNEGVREDLLETRNRGEMLMLAVTELDEAIDAHDQGIADDKLPHRRGLDVELADCAIRLFDTIGAEQRRGGKQPLVTYNKVHGTISVEAFVRDYRNERRGMHGDILRIVGDLSKALDEGYRREKVSVARFHLTAALLRIIALCEIEDIPLFDIIAEKREFNRNRADHKIENRLKDGGKKC